MTRTHIDMHTHTMTYAMYVNTHIRTHNLRHTHEQTPLKRQRTPEIQGLQSRQRLERGHEGFDTLRPHLVACVHVDSGENERCDVVVRPN